MKRYAGFLLLAAVVALFVAPTRVDAQQSGFIRRYAANFAGFGYELLTTAAPEADGAGGTVIYDKSLFIPADVNTMYITISGTNDTHGGRAAAFSALVDDAVCNPGASNPAGFAPPGWINLRRIPNYNVYYDGPDFPGDGGGGGGDAHDNAVNYTWCCPVTWTADGTHNFKVKMASLATPNDAAETADVGTIVFLEAVHFFVDGSKIQSGQACVADTTFPPPES